MAHHEPFRALGSIEWSDIVTQQADGTLLDRLSSIFLDAKSLVASLPQEASTLQESDGLAPPSGKTGGRARSATDSAVGPRSVSQGGEVGDERLRKEWKEVKISDNPHSISVYKLSAKDGRGAWFARRSVHRDQDFQSWRDGLKDELVEGLKRSGAGQAEAAKGNVRGIGAERIVEHVEPGHGADIQVYQLSAKFGGPTTPRDFVAARLTQDDSADVAGRPRHGPRQFMIVSKPCVHADCPPRQGFIRGQYESLEMVREVPTSRQLRKVRSSIEVNRAELDANMAGLKPGLPTRTSSFTGAQNEGGLEADDGDTAIEWVMITRSDPGGNVPRFLVEKGTPPGIVSDADLFVKWLSSKTTSDGGGADDKTASVGGESDAEIPPPLPQRKSTVGASKAAETRVQPPTPNVGPSGFYSMLSSAVEAASSAVVAKLPGALSGRATDSEPSQLDDSDDTSSVGSFASAEEGEPTPVPMDKQLTGAAASSLSTRSGASDEGSTATGASPAATQLEKELRKLEERRRRAHEKLMRVRERSASKHSDNKERDAVALERLREKHEREMAKHEERYRRDVKKLQDKRVADDKKAEERRRKELEREEKANAWLELEKTRAERDVALKQIEVLKDQVGELQAQNTMLVAKLGKLGAIDAEGIISRNGIVS